MRGNESFNAPLRWSYKEAKEALGALKGALEEAGLKLPSLGLEDWVALVSTGGPLVELGRVRPDVAMKLAEVIRRGAQE